MYNCYILRGKNQDYPYTIKKLFRSLIFLKGKTIKHILYLIAAPRSQRFKKKKKKTLLPLRETPESLKTTQAIAIALWLPTGSRG